MLIVSFRGAGKKIFFPPLEHRVCIRIDIVRCDATHWFALELI